MMRHTGQEALTVLREASPAVLLGSAGQAVVGGSLAVAASATSAVG